MKPSIRAIQGTSRLVFDVVEGITNTVENMHESIARTPMSLFSTAPGSTRARGFIASAVYQTIRGINAGLRTGVDKSFALLPEDRFTAEETRTEARWVAALNGVCGDHLAATDNALATPMTFRLAGKALDLHPQALQAALPQASPHLLVLVHGLSLSELNWKRGERPSIGDTLSDELDCTALYLRYNTGRHISTNGQQFANMLQTIIAAWPVPVESISLLGHSMGGLVIRSACWYAQCTEADWLSSLKQVVCLGSPHHGSPLEKAGHAFEAAMEKLPYTEPLLLAKKRSAGIKDLRHGSLLDEDWLPDHRAAATPKSHAAVPLVPGVDYFFAAASVGRDQFDPLGHMLGDLLVRPDSATGVHKNELRQLTIKPENCRVFHEKNHFDLLGDSHVHEQLIDWFRR